MTDTTYDVTTGDIGSQLVLVVTASNTAGTVTAESAPTSLVSDWVDIVGETSPVYQVLEGDLGHDLRLIVRATNTAGQEATPSLPVGPVVEEATGQTSGDTVSDDLGLVEVRLFQRGETP